VSTRSLTTTALVLVTLGFVSPAYAQEAGASGAAAGTLVQWSIITAGFALAIAAAFGALGQGKAVSAAVEAIARNPSASNDIRANLLLHWLRRHFPRVPIVFLMRHPCAVAASQLRGRWGLRAADLLRQPRLVEDFLSPFAGLIHSARDEFDNLLLVWCVENYVPLRQFRRGEIFILFYEELLRHPEREIERLFGFLGRPAGPGVFEQFRRPSAQSRSWSAVLTGDDPLDSWRRHIDAGQIRRAVELLRLFGLDELYDGGSMPRTSGARLSGGGA